MASPNLSTSRTTNNTPAEHVADHNAVHGYVNQLYIRVNELGLNVKHPDFGAVGDGVADDTAAFNAAYAQINAGGSSALRAMPIVIPPGTYRITSTLAFNDVCAKIQGVGGWSNPTAGQPAASQGSILVWDGGNAPVIKVQGSRGCLFENFMIIGSNNGAKRPTALIEMYVTSGDAFKNGLARFSKLLLGKLANYGGFGNTDIVADRGIYWNSTASNTQNDSSVADQIRFDGCTTGWETSGTQSVLMGIRGSQFWYCGTGIKTVSDLQLENVYFALSTVVDMDISSSARVHARYLASEFANQFAAIAGSGSSLAVEGGYTQISASTRGDRCMIIATDDAYQVLRLKDFQFTANSGYATPASKPIIQFKPATNSLLAQKYLHLDNVRYFVAQPNTGFDEAMLDVATPAGTNSTVTVEGNVQAPLPGATGGDSSNSGPRRHFFMRLKNGQTPSLYRDDRIQQRRAASRRVAVRGSTGTTRAMAISPIAEYCAPIEVPAGQSITAASVNVTVGGGAGAVIRFGIREFDDSGLPTATVTDLGTASTVGTGDAAVTFGAAYVAKGRKTWLCVQAEVAAITVVGVNGPVDGVELAASSMSSTVFASFLQTGATAGTFLGTAPTSSAAGAAPLISVTVS